VAPFAQCGEKAGEWGGNVNTFHYGPGVDSALRAAWESRYGRRRYRGAEVAEEVRLDNKLYLSCLWPGLPELWWRGRLSALPTAVAFGIALNVMLVARFIYPEWLTFSLVRVGGWVGVAVWFYCTIKNIKDLPGLLHPRKASKQPDRYGEAHLAYLRSDWPRAESLLRECLAVEERDPPALLLLAGVYRHTGRFESARGCIELLRTTEVADRWWLEVDAEEKRLLRDQSYQTGGNGVSTAENRGHEEVASTRTEAVAA
jgi:hypothetical protein